MYRVQEKQGNWKVYEERNRYRLRGWDRFYVVYGLGKSGDPGRSLKPFIYSLSSPSLLPPISVFVTEFMSLPDPSPNSI